MLNIDNHFYLLVNNEAAITFLLPSMICMLSVASGIYYHHYVLTLLLSLLLFTIGSFINNKSLKAKLNYNKYINDNKWFIYFNLIYNVLILFVIMVF